MGRTPEPAKKTIQSNGINHITTEIPQASSGSLVGMAVQKHETKEKHHVEKAEVTANQETLQAEPEVILLHHRQKLRPRSENFADRQKHNMGTNGHNELQNAIQHLRKVSRKMSNGSEASSEPEFNGNAYKVNDWNGITNGGNHSDYSSPSTVADEKTNIVNIDSDSDATSGVYDFSESPRASEVSIQHASKYNNFNITNNSRHHSSSPDEAESSISGSSYYGDIDEAAQEMLELSRKIEDHRL